MSINYRLLRERLRIEEVLCWMSWKASSHGAGQLRGRCPFCRDPTDGSTPCGTSSDDCSFSVNTDRNLYRCFRCQASGNALDLWRSYRQIPLYTAAQEIEHRLGQNTQPPNRT